MPQKSVYSGIDRRRFEGNEAQASFLAAGDTVLATIDCQGCDLLLFHFDVTTQALDNFDVFAKAHPDAQYEDFTPASWTVLPTNGRFVEADGDLNTQAAGSSGYFGMRVSGLALVQVRISAAVNGALVTPFWSLSQWGGL